MSGPSSKSRRDGAEAVSADRLLSTAAALFRRKGYAQSTTREIAELLGIKKASLYHHMQSKGDLLVALCTESMQRITEAAQTAIQRAPESQRLRQMMRAHVVSILADRDMHTVSLTELRALPSEQRRKVVALRDAYQSMVNDLIAEEQRAGRIRQDQESTFLTLALLNLVNFPVFWYDPEGGMSPEEIGVNLSDLFMQGAAVTRQGRKRRS